MAQQPTHETGRDDHDAKAIAAFPFERIETTGELALSRWQQLKTMGRGVPLVLGGDDSVSRIMDAFEPAIPGYRTAAEILAVAEGLRHPEGLAARRAQDAARAREHAKRYADPPSAGPEMPRQLTPFEAPVLEAMRNAIERLLPSLPATVGSRGEAAPGLSVASDSVTGKPLPKVHIALIPTNDWTTVPAHLNWGGWNACPHPEYHVAALRSWRDRFGAELVGLSHDTTNLTVGRRPSTHEDALELAREQYDYCGDIVHWGTQTVDCLAESLLTDEWWLFWWD